MPILAIQTMRWNSPIAMAARLRTAARAADEFGVSCRELARRFADQVDADLASDADPLGLPIGLVWARDEAGKPLSLDPRPFPALMIAANQRWLPDRNVRGDNRTPRMRRVHDQTEG